VYFTAVNPGIEYGGFFGEHKDRILKQIPDEYKPWADFFSNEDSSIWHNRIAQYEESRFPLVFKPNVGERGDEVRIVRDKAGLLAHLKTVDYDFLLQEYIDYPIELGVLYSKIPNAKAGQIQSIALKNFLCVHGDGVKNVKQLMCLSRRAILQIPRFEKEKPELLKYVPKMKESLMIERIGNHCLGTEFIDANDWINHKTKEVFRKISRTFSGFYYGRFDLKVPSFEDLENGVNIKIFELNGVSSEAGHIYDARHRVLFAYKEVLRLWKLLFVISKQNHDRGIPYASSKDLWRISMQHFFGTKR